jgi:CRISPR system Cascade subunit CasC
MKIEIHVLQSFPPANLNRDENGMPKSTVFGGRPRARISSQCQKRAVRKYYHKHHDELGIDPNLFADRSRSFNRELTKILVDLGITSGQAEIAAKFAVSVLTEKPKKEKDNKGKKVKKNEDIPDDETEESTSESANNLKSDTILFLGRTEVESIAQTIKDNWSDIEGYLSTESSALGKLKKLIIPVVQAPKDSKSAFGKSGDVALFGRMMAVLPEGKVDAAVQMAHAISVNTLQQEFDFFTAVDDLGTTDDQGADHLGETGYNSSTYYRYTNVDIDQLTKNLGSTESVQSVVKAFSQAFIQAIPSGHQNSFAAHTPPALVMVVVRKGQPISLIDAFEEPVRPKDGNSLLLNAVTGIVDHWNDLTIMYINKTEYVGAVTRSKLAKEGLKNFSGDKKSSVEELLTAALAIAFPGA